MTKKEALKHITIIKGYIPYIEIFEIYGDDDEVPQELIDVSIKDDKSKENFIVCSPELAEYLKNLDL